MQNESLKPSSSKSDISSPDDTPEKGSKLDAVKPSQQYDTENPEKAFTEDELVLLQEVFQQFDSDGNGSIDKRELKRLLRKTGYMPSEKELKDLIMEVDANQNEMLDWSEFLQLIIIMKHRQEKGSAPQIDSALRDAIAVETSILRQEVLKMQSDIQSVLDFLHDEKKGGHSKRLTSRTTVSARRRAQNAEKPPRAPGRRDSAEEQASDGKSVSRQPSHRGPTVIGGGLTFGKSVGNIKEAEKMFEKTTRRVSDMPAPAALSFSSLSAVVSAVKSLRDMDSDELKRLWNSIIGMMVLVNLVAVPFRLAMLDGTYSLLDDWLDLFTVLLYTADVLAMFGLRDAQSAAAKNEAKQQQRGMEDRNLKAGAAAELQKMMSDIKSAVEAASDHSGELFRHSSAIVTNLVPILPWHRFVSICGGAIVFICGRSDWQTTVQLVAAFCLLLQLLKASRLLTAASDLEKRAHVNPAILRLAYLTVLCFLIAHWVGCLWVLLGNWERYHGVESDWLPPDHLFGPKSVISASDKWLRALYWGFKTITQGTSETAETSAEVAFSLALLFLGMSVYATIVGNVGSLLSNLDRAAVEHEEKLDKVQAYLRYRNIPPRLQDRVLDYYDYVFSTSGGLDEESLLKDLPVSIRTDIALYLNRDIIKKVPFLKNASDSFISVLVRLLKSEVSAPGEYVIRYGDVGKEMYFIHSGVVSVISADGTRIFNVLREGSFFGEYALLYSQTRTASIRAETYADFFVLKQEDFHALLEDYPEFEVVVRRHGLGRIIRKITLFKDSLTEDCIEALIDAMTPEAFSSGQDIVTQGDEADSMYFIVRGSAEVIIGGNRVVKTMSDGEFFGELALLFDQPRSATVRASTHVDTFALNREDFEDVMDAFPKFAQIVRERAHKQKK